ncbi:UDP-N-acetylglucosamine:LPS N-acetylglucosamine transferase [Salinibacillus kushneri]|uniref:UDP-N-acetylglucosamine:LPS N-acetylglucosamine transferase n=1 Tax=Salinibacillus kushneri TaxID=237682 RepID=A0A1I0FDQ5_9BACI|nr:UDP-glucuronosyltransferase [Salinibacillus kushneri]SET55335.1 UDP-N-acetylglucosamine:LPS N-acetylglucosamine transferase [Salinibacillus kushneri]
MKKVLFLPFLQISSGHHQVADSLIDGLMELDSTIECHKVDILHYGYGKLEQLISTIYLKWIDHFPQTYSWIYRKIVCENQYQDKRYRHYEWLFTHVMESILEEEQPDIIVCTHALPSYLLSQLKERKGIQTPVVNVYTDYFIHQLWGKNNIDFHFVPSLKMKEFLLDKGVKDSEIFVTGIPVHHQFSSVNTWLPLDSSKLNFMITGGNLGVGLIQKFVTKVKEERIHYHVLCGKNHSLYNRLKELPHSNVTPIPYISSRQKMDELYDSCDGIITKPGGVTISESLFKRVPIFVYHTLPGQEEMNMEQLSQLGLASPFYDWKYDDAFEKRLLQFYQDDNVIHQYEQNLNQYHAHLNPTTPAELIYQLGAVSH